MKTAKPTTNITEIAAQMMLESGRFWTTNELAEALKINKVKASGTLRNIRYGAKYRYEYRECSSTMKVISIGGTDTKQDCLWSLALGIKTPGAFFNRV
ncbi:hypothetical protein IT774_05105 [Salinimonas marina]|uniref:Uncharacterized protein n=1 Tax=Salinimonas marina TaxID=2785918 RepID=A0A7S9DZ06_9ALTE|nr:hypothetical protein [Salinimonas marina]QPG06552.1 hypothetical protein IT774_05105 [Salinimonas marina]